jgi:hypothetical protein
VVTNLDVTLVVCLTLHDLALARSRPLKDRVDWGINRIVSSFEQLLEAQSGTGICLIDRLPSERENQYLAGLFARTSGMGPSGDYSLKRTRLLGLTCSRASHAASVLDVALGGFAYCLTDRRPEKRALVCQFFRLVAPSMAFIEFTGERISFPRGSCLTRSTGRSRSTRRSIGRSNYTSELC